LRVATGARYLVLRAVPRKRSGQRGLLTMRTRRPLAIAIATCAAAATTAVAIAVTTNAGEAEATLPPALSKTLASSRVAESVRVSPGMTRRVSLADGSEVFLVSGGGGDLCIGLRDGSAACGPASEVAAGRLFLIVVRAAAGSRHSVIPAVGSAHAVLYGYQPDGGAERASVLGPSGQSLGSGDVVDGVYRVELTLDAGARRMVKVRFDGQAPPAPIDLDAPASSSRSARPPRGRARPRLAPRGRAPRRRAR
jgi:hypothetical protein